MSLDLADIEWLAQGDTPTGRRILVNGQVPDPARRYAVDRKLVGPSYQDVAARYAGQKDAVSRLAEKIQKGGSGSWGPVPMPPNAAVNEADAKKLVNWVLSLK